MRHVFVLMVAVLICLTSFCQTLGGNSSTPQTTTLGSNASHTSQPANNPPPATNPSEVEDQHWTFIAGVGFSYITRKSYADPAIDPTDNSVEIQRANRLKTNLTIGLAYIFGSNKDIKSNTTQQNGNGVTVEQEVGQTRQHGFTAAVFLNPVLFSKITESQNFFNLVDFGAGLGHTFSGGFTVLGTVEFFGVDQPRDWFITKFKGTNVAYVIENQQQKTIDLKDRNIFTSKLVVTFGFKLCFSFNTMKKFATATASQTGAQAAGNQQLRVLQTF